LSDRVQWAETAAVAILLAGLVMLGFGFFRRGRVPLQFSRKSSFLSLTIFGGVAALSVATYYAGLGLAEGFGFDPQIAAYFAPLALATVLIALLIDARTSLLVGIGLTLFVAYRVDGGLWLVTYYLVGVLIAGIAARSSRRRLDLLKTGMYVGLAQAVLVPIIIVLSGQSFASLLLPMIAAAMASGALVSLATLGALPLFEHWFDEATELRLLEMAAGDSPILKELALTSPGTYHHSIMVANLAEAGADAVGANGLRCRVMALYHDIGKIRRPSYFSENQRAGENLHDRIPPESSAKIIFDHVRDGLQMAKKERLGNAVIEGIVEHHGTSLLRAFYQRALQGPHGNGTREEYFRYPGRKPKSREAGILMLADSTEAATRALTNPDPQELRQRVNQVLDRQVSDGQLDNCEMTLKDLAQMEEAFVRVLTLGVYHNRIEYPPTPGSGERLADDLDRKSDYGDRGVRFLRRMVERSN
jgi:putative nucleotidyltransferase with HDIG domain